MSCRCCSSFHFNKFSSFIAPPMITERDGKSFGFQIGMLGPWLSKGEGRRQVTSHASFSHGPNDPKLSFVYAITVFSVRCLCQFGTAIQSHTDTRKAAWKQKRPMPRNGIPTVQILRSGMHAKEILKPFASAPQRSLLY